ncbi:MAG: metallophosphoesterase family protein [Phocaeicola sp.]
MEVANNSEIDEVLLGGDIIDAPTDNSLSILQTSLNELKAPYLYVLGKHDWTYTWGYCNDTARNEYLPKFKSFFKDENSDFQVLEFEDLAVVGLDNSADQFTQAAADAFSNYVKNLNKPIILIMHVPIHGSNIQTTCEAVWGRDISLGESGIIPNQSAQQIINLIEDQNSPVIGVLSGHIHMNVQDELNSKGTLETTADAAYKGRGILLTIKPE